jgi:UDP-N-acetylglucosamine:LPS N-acetylglucosamine transferase
VLQDEVQTPRANRARRVLILTAPVGDGHLAAARALAEDFDHTHADVEVTVVDVLAFLGPVLRFLLLDAYRLQLRRSPWIFGLLFAAFLRLKPLRLLGRAGLVTLGARPLARLIRHAQADVVISTYPAATSVLGYLRRRGRVTGIACATITDLGGICFWAHPGIDLHLVMHGSLVAEVEREAGSGSACLTKPLVGHSFIEPVDRARVRAELGIPDGCRLVVVSGGGWGVGDLTGATQTALALERTCVISIAGRNETLECELRAAFADDKRVRVLGFTTRMSELLAAADALVHTTGGVTCLEALARNCPVISYGACAGHVPTVSRAMHSLGVATHVQTLLELKDGLESALAGGADARPIDYSSAPSPANAVLGARRRTSARPTPRRRRTVIALAAATVVGALLASSDAAHALFADDLHRAPSPTRKTGPAAVRSAARSVDPAGRRVFVLGRSVDGRPITAIETGDFDSSAKTLVVGCIHGSECAGIAIAERLARSTPPRELDLWIVPDLNPDGAAAGTRGNARGVDLNRNAPWRWQRLRGLSDSGPGPLSEPESRIAYRLISRLRPDISIWFHQHLDVVDESGSSLAIERRFAALTDLRLARLPREPGSFVGWENHRFRAGTAFVVELPAGTLDSATAARFARAVVAVTQR